METSDNLTADVHQENERGFSWQLKLLIMIIWLTGFLIVMLVSAGSLRNNVLDELDTAAFNMRDSLQHRLGRYSEIASGIARMRVVEQALTGERDVATLKHMLLRANENMKTEALMVFRPDGYPLASTNDFGSDFAHQDLSFRPYFQQAMLGEKARYYATGLMQGRRGYYFSAPVFSDGKVVGVAVAKADLDPIFFHIKKMAPDFMIIGYDGLIFAASRSDWVYNTLYSLPESQRLAIYESHRYQETPLLSISSESVDEIFSLDSIRLKTADLMNSYFVRRTRLADLGWHLFALAPSSVLFQDVAVYLVYYSLAFALLFLIWMYQRKRTEVQRHVARLNEELERRVTLLTRELKESNEELLNLVEHYRTTQDQLKETRGQLVQTAKLAVLGEMSAGINHELSQPLLALMTYIENSQRLLQKAEYEKVGRNLFELQQVTANMRDIISRFKVFARRTPPDPRPFDIQEVLAGTQVIMKPLLKKSELQLRIRNAGNIPPLFGDPVQVQQVLVNLVTNSADAVENQKDGWIAVDIRHTGEIVTIIVTDSGAGIAVELRDKIFEPFFTTKARGLGLGLALSQRIVETLGGSLILRETADGGTCFVLTLPVYQRGESE